MAISANVPTARQGRSGWLTAAAAILVVEGALGLLYLPIIDGWGPWLVLVAGISIGSIAAGAGVLRRRAWARILAAAIAGVSLALNALAAVGSLWGSALGVAIAFDPLLPVSLVVWLVVAFAVARRWSSAPREAD